MKGTASNPHNVDICVTCVSEKPPQLPLREELPSLGIEVVYNAQGVGAKASKNESKRLVKRFREKEQVKELKHPRFFPSSPQKVKAKQKERKRQENALRIPKALSYQSYKNCLAKSKSEGTESSSSISSWENSSTIDSSSIENKKSKNRLKEWTRHTKKQNHSSPTVSRIDSQLPTTVEFPTHTPEEIAINEAFKIFSESATVEPQRKALESREGMQTEAMSLAEEQNDSTDSRDQSSGFDPSTLTSMTEPERMPKQVRVVGHTDIKGEIHDKPLHFNPSENAKVGQAALQGKNKKPTKEEVPSYLQHTSADAEGYHYPSKADEVSKNQASEPSLKTGFVKKNETFPDSISDGLIFDATVQAPEFYDLTGISDDEAKDNVDTEAMSKDLSTLSSQKQTQPENEEKQDGVEIFPSPAIRQQLPGLRLHIPEIDDGYGRIILDLSSVCEEDGPRIPNPPTSPFHKKNEDRIDQVRLEGVQEEERSISPDEATDNFRIYHDDDILQSPTYPTSHLRGKEDASSHSPQMGSEKYSKNMKALFDDASSIEVTKSASQHQFFLESYDGSSDTDGDSKAKETGEEALRVAQAFGSSHESDSQANLKVLSGSFSKLLEKEQYRGGDNGEENKNSFIPNDDFATRAKVDYSSPPSDKKNDLVEDIRQSNSRDENDYQIDASVHSQDSFEQTEPSRAIQLLDALNYGHPIPKDYKTILEENPHLAKAKLPGSEQYPLHAICSNAFPDRFSLTRSCRVEDLVQDVSMRRSLIEAFIEIDDETCRYIDKNGDLPVHLLARNLMEWEARWYQKVYEKAREDNDEGVDNGAGITRLYQTMSICIDLLLRPVSTEGSLCKQYGSVGRLLPLHIAAIFTVSYNTLRSTIETSDGAASEMCDLKDIRTFIPDDSVPLELHDRLSTDFPKWEIERVSSTQGKEIVWTQSTLDQSYGTVDGMRRSDLMFCFHPSIAPYRHDQQRIQRIEAKVIQEMAHYDIEDEDKGLSLASKRFWKWICTYVNHDDSDDGYSSSVKRIVQRLPLASVKALAVTTDEAGKPILDIARPICAQIIRTRLDEIAAHSVPIPLAPVTSGHFSAQKHSALRQWDETMASNYFLHGRGLVGPLCRKLFNITEYDFPSSFVFLPYRLVKDDDDRLGLETAEAAATAMKFADCLLQITDPKKIMHFLEKKTLRFLGTSLRNDLDDGWMRNESETKEVVNRLLSLYKEGPAYFYFLDEYTGIPIVEESNSLYPLVVNDSVDMVRKVLPLMLSGMILMRGEKATPVLASVLLNEHLGLVQHHWVDAGKDLLGYLYSPQTEWTNSFLQDLLPLREKVLDFVDRGVSENAPQPGHTGLASEWVVELSLVKMIVEMHDSHHIHCGLKPRRAGPTSVLWTKEKHFLDLNNREHLYFMDFKSPLALRNSSNENVGLMKDLIGDLEEEQELSCVDAEQSEEAQIVRQSGYDLLFSDLAMVPSSTVDDKMRDGSNHSRRLWSRDEDRPESSITLPPSKTTAYASSSAPISLVEFDDDLDLDGVLQLRILLDEQEAKLEFLKEKISEIEDTEQDLLDQEEKITDMLDEVINQKDSLQNKPSSVGLSKARNLLLRICDLEDRVLCREVEIGQLKNEITCFEMQAGHDDFRAFITADEN